MASVGAERQAPLSPSGTSPARACPDVRGILAADSGKLNFPSLPGLPMQAMEFGTSGPVSAVEGHGQDGLAMLAWT